MPGLPPWEDVGLFLETQIEEPPVLIEGILHKGTKLILAGSSKTFKSWCLIDMAVSIATGEPWQSRRTSQGRGLFINFELQRWSSRMRIRDIAQEKHVRIEDLKGTQLSGTFADTPRQTTP